MEVSAKAHEDAASPLEPTKKASAPAQPSEEKPSPPTAATASDPKVREEVTRVLGSSKDQSEESPPASSDKQEEKTSEKGSKSPPRPDDKKMSPPPAEEDTDILEFISATEGEASSSAWELVPEKKIARKIGVKSDSELDHLVKKVVKEEAEQRKLTSTAAISSSSSSSSSSSHPIFWSYFDDSEGPLCYDPRRACC